MRRRRPPHREVVGWREWIALPDLGVERIKAKVDTGAATSSLHAFDLRLRREGETTWAEFEVHPIQRSSRDARRVRCRVVDERRVRSSNGKVEVRPVVRTRVTILSRSWEVDVTLTRRDEMGFRMLLGRSALRGRLVVDVARSFVGRQGGKGETG